MQSINPAYDPRAVEAAGVVREEYNVACREVERLTRERDHALACRKVWAMAAVQGATAEVARLRALLAEALVPCPTCHGKPGGLVGIGPGIRGVIQVPPCQTCAGGRCPGYVSVGDEP
jgi:hypothetical protein